MTTVYLARHGESDWNVERRWQGHADRPLTDRGREQARDLAARLADLELDAVYSSDLRRAWETAEPVAASHGLEVIRLPELREVDVGSWCGLTRDECAERFPDAFARWRDGGSGWEDGESYEEMGERIVAVVQRLAADHPDGSILVVSHGGPIRAVHAAVLGVDIATHRRTGPVEPNARLSAVAAEGGRLSRLEP
ncbi:MAG TPA: histidine phosphatase family protein, partial [Gaiellaceae bacterium]|jgi:broad specificity phosphatase PhoE|nr:histidine phosphatase family protein [Gaiellaceae bacterium]